QHGQPGLRRQVVGGRDHALQAAKGLQHLSCSSADGNDPADLVGPETPGLRAEEARQRDDIVKRRCDAVYAQPPTAGRAPATTPRREKRAFPPRQSRIRTAAREAAVATRR
ncbi:MAG TPA: hypothetical protein VKN76_12350, partial [Kiloniellaceae bacterium]|nr:hypothetical protein [Kiloniellaceae bacterium]